MYPPSPPTSSEGNRFTLSVKQVLAALVAFYAFVTYQFVRVRSLTAQLPATRRDAFGFNPDASLPVQYLDHVVGATIGEWGHSLWHAKPVTAVLVSALPWVVLLVGIAVLGALTAYVVSDRLGVGALPQWVVPYTVYLVVFLVAFFALRTGSNGASGFYLSQAQQVRDVPLSVGARRLVALGFLVGALLVGIARRRVFSPVGS